MPATCSFCAIIRGDEKAVIILETDRLIAFLDHRPVFRGHTLLVPKLHVRLLSDLPADRVPDFFHAAQRLERAVEDGLGADGSMILINNVVSQSVPHLHLHVIPRNFKDGLRFWLGPRHPYDAAAPAEAYADRIRAALPPDEVPGLSPPTESDTTDPLTPSAPRFRACFWLGGGLGASGIHRIDHEARIHHNHPGAVALEAARAAAHNGGYRGTQASSVFTPLPGHAGEVPMPADPNRFARDLFAPLPARYDLLAEVLSFGQNGRWRSAMVDRVLPTDGVILDVASGTAGVALQLAGRGETAASTADAGHRGAADGAASAADGRQRGARVIGVDLTEEMLRQGYRQVTAAGRGDQVRLVVGRAEQLPFPDGSFDALTFTYLLRYVRDPQATLAELARVLRPGGTMASLEFCVPTGALWHPAWWAYTRLALPAGGFLLGGPEWFRVGRFLGPNISAHYRKYPVSWTVEAWQKAGLTDVGARVMSLGGGLVMWGTRAGA